MNRVAWLLVAGVALIVSSSALAQERRAPERRQVEPDKVSEFMKVKLVHSQKLLEALALEDFGQIAENAQELSLLSQAATWKVLQTPEYLEQSTEFRRRADALREAARKKNIDGAAIAYVELTLKCVQCHKYVRNVRVGAAPELHPLR
jgi:hypothetical protein